MHYDEFQAVKLARQLIENEEDDEDDNDDQLASASVDQHTLETTSSEAASSVHDSGDTGDVHMLSEDVVWCACCIWLHVMSVTAQVIYSDNLHRLFTFILKKDSYIRVLLCWSLTAPSYPNEMSGCFY